jgi:hypothetical protein
MRTRGVCAVVAGVVGAAVVHALDEAGQLPGVHETVAVRDAMTPLLTVGWLALAGSLGGLAARTRPVAVGGAGALVIAAIPELAGRTDPGAFFEPAALAGAALQWLLLMAVLGVLFLTDRQLTATPFRRTRLPSAWLPRTPVRRRRRAHLLASAGRPRAPPRHVHSCCFS